MAWPFICTLKDALFQVKIDQVVLEKKMKMWKVYHTTTTKATTDNVQSSFELSAQVS